MSILGGWGVLVTCAEGRRGRYYRDRIAEAVDLCKDNERMRDAAERDGEGRSARSQQDGRISAEVWMMGYGLCSRSQSCANGDGDV